MCHRKVFAPSVDGRVGLRIRDEAGPPFRRVEFSSLDQIKIWENNSYTGIFLGFFVLFL